MRRGRQPAVRPDRANVRFGIERARTHRVEYSGLPGQERKQLFWEHDISLTNDGKRMPVASEQTASRAKWPPLRRSDGDQVLAERRSGRPALPRGNYCLNPWVLAPDGRSRCEFASE